MSKQEEHRHSQQCGGYQRGGGWGVVKGEGVKYMVTEDDFTLGGGPTVQYTNDRS